jgi:hypothetical protein
VNGQPTVPPREDACCTRVIEVDVREDEMPQVAELEPMSRKPGFERGQTGGRSAVDERRLVAGQQIRRDNSGVPEEKEVDELGAAT